MNKDSDRVVYPMYFSILCSLRLFAVDFFARGLHSRPYCLTAPLGVPWRHRSRDHLITHIPFPIGGPLERCL